MTSTILTGNVFDVLPTMESDSVNCVVTSPPYWGLRDYGVEGQLGLEPTPEEYVAKMVSVFAEVRRVLRDDGTLWLNLGDSYATHYKGGGVTCSIQSSNVGSFHDWRGNLCQPGLKTKDLVGIPWSVAFALRADGWYLRSDIIWSKPDPMPESVKDRPTVAHEHVFLLTKQAQYWYDADAIRAPHAPSSLERIKHGLKHRHPDGVGIAIPPVDTDKMGERFCHPKGRNARSVWTIATQSYHDAHFAVMPEALVEPCVLAGCPEGGVVLDPFTGSGTVGAVACRLGRRFVGIELNPDYVKMAERRIAPYRDQLRLDMSCG